jgi:sulfur-carrier protein adenylyltransferase/sulfurtransferase
MTALLRILDEARWAPSGDNTQPWMFEPRGERELVVHGRDTRDHCVYDLQGEASQLSIGAMLETISIAASNRGWSSAVQRQEGSAPNFPQFLVRFSDSDIAPDPLAEFIRHRSVQRRPLKTRPLTESEKSKMEQSVGPNFRIRWFEGSALRWRCAKLMFSNAHIRLTMPEAYTVHRDVIEWGARESVDRVPDKALGADPLGLLVMRVAMKSWKRVHFANRFLAGTWIPRLQMDLYPSWACAAHLILIADHEPETIDDHVLAGRAVQRLWLTATQLKLWHQPEMTPLIFAKYLRKGVRFTQVETVQKDAPRIAQGLTELLGSDAARAVWMGRIGEGHKPVARSIRKPLSDLLVDSAK